jgi:WD40 repeat protein
MAADSRKMVTGSADTTVRLFGRASGRGRAEQRCIAQGFGHVAQVSCLVMRPSCCVSASWDGDVKVWSLLMPKK